MIEIRLTAENADELFTKLRDVVRGTADAKDALEAAAPFMEKDFNLSVAREEAPVETPSATLDDCKRIAGEVIRAGKRAELAALLEKYGVARTSELSEEQFADFAADAGALE